MSAEACKICGNVSGNAPDRVREMPLGTRDAFDYFQCAQCGCLQITHVPDNLGDYYRAHYFAYGDYRGLARRPLRAWFDRRRVRAAPRGSGRLDRILAKVIKPLDYVRWVKHCARRCPC